MESAFGKEAIPVQQSSHGPRREGNRQVWGEAEDQDAQGSADETHKQDRLPADPVAQPPPEQTRGELGEREGGGYHAGVEGYSALVLRDVEVLNHEIDVGENSHEGDWFTYPADGCKIELAPAVSQEAAAMVSPPYGTGRKPT